MNIDKSVKLFKTVIPSINRKYRPYAEQIINLYKDRKIEKTINSTCKPWQRTAKRNYQDQREIRQSGKRKR